MQTFISIALTIYNDIAVMLVLEVFGLIKMKCTLEICKMSITKTQSLASEIEKCTEQKNIHLKYIYCLGTLGLK